jgi:DNA-binding XRE family transcriptional regulator
LLPFSSAWSAVALTNSKPYERLKTNSHSPCQQNSSRLHSSWPVQPPASSSSSPPAQSPPSKLNSTQSKSSTYCEPSSQKPSPTYSSSDQTALTEQRQGVSQTKKPTDADWAQWRLVGTNIKRLRLQSGRTMENLAWAAGASKSYLNRVEPGSNAPSLNMRRARAAELEVEP